MIGFRVICIFRLALSIFAPIVIILLIAALTFNTQSDDTDFMTNFLNTAYEITFIKGVGLVTYLISEIYIVVCVNSLYLEVKEQNYGSQNQAVKIDYLRRQSLPSYNQVMQPGGFAQIIVPRQPAYQVEYKFKQHAV